VTTLSLQATAHGLAVGLAAVQPSLAEKIRYRWYRFMPEIVRLAI
jgi:hypothetical protein